MKAWKIGTSNTVAFSRDGRLLAALGGCLRLDHHEGGSMSGMRFVEAWPSQSAPSLTGLNASVPRSDVVYAGVRTHSHQDRYMSEPLRFQPARLALRGHACGCPGEAILTLSCAPSGTGRALHGVYELVSHGMITTVAGGAIAVHCCLNDHA